MPWSHHSHSGQYCLHAKGTLRAVVQEAIAQGFELYGLSEHMPRYRAQDLYPEESHLSCADLTHTFERYLLEASQLQKEVSGKIKLLVGLETDVIHPHSIPELQSLLAKHVRDIAYVVGSIHHANEVPIDFDQETYDRAVHSFSSLEGDKTAMLMHNYFDAQFELLESIQPEVVGHFDLCRLYHPELDLRSVPGVWDKVRRNVKLAVEYGALFEVNAAAFRKGWKTAYPGQEVLELILAEGGRLCLSDDSHGPHAVGLHYRDAYKWLRSQNVDTLYYLDAPKSGETPLARGRGKTVVRKAQTPWWEHPFFVKWH